MILPYLLLRQQQNTKSVVLTWLFLKPYLFLMLPHVVDVESLPKLQEKSKVQYRRRSFFAISVFYLFSLFILLVDILFLLRRVHL